jgi:hypothetical protein
VPARRATAAGVSALLQYYYPIRDALSEGYSLRAAWDAVNAGVEAGGATTEPAGIADMSVVAGRAWADLGAANALAAAGDLAAIDAGMMAPAPWLGPSGLGQGFDTYQIRAALDLEGLELDRPIYMDLKIDFSLEGWSKAELIDYAVAQFQTMLDDYDEDALAALGIEPGLTITGLTDVQVFQL